MVNLLVKALTRSIYLKETTGSSFELIKYPTVSAGSFYQSLVITQFQNTNADTLHKTGDLVQYNMDGSRYNFGKVTV